MKKRIINLEINELSPSLLVDYLNKSKNSNLFKLRSNSLLSIYKTKALDVKKEDLYPSQTWASFSTGKKYEKHNCYRYSDPIDKNYLIWTKLASSKKSVGIIGSLHSSKIPKDLFSNDYYKFYLPDCFTNNEITKPLKYKYFQILNVSLVQGSARITGLFNICKNLFKNILKIIENPETFGISFFSLKMLIKIAFFAIKYKNKELLRMAQFPLIGSIFSQMFVKHLPDYSSLFSNHVAGNMHRYWYAHDISAFKNKGKYTKNWLKKHKNTLTISIDLLDEYIGFIYKKKQFKDSTILITSSMGQEPNPKFDSKFLSKYDGKIEKINKFLNHLSSYQKKFFKLNVEYDVEKNMAPHYGFTIKNKKNLDLDRVSVSIESFVKNLGMKNKVGRQGASIVLTVCPSTDLNLQNTYTMEEADKKYAKYGFKFFSVEDHHSGSHCPEGLLAVINPSQNFTKKIKQELDNDGQLNYLKFHKIVMNYI